ncbi:Histone methylation DOT1 [Lasiodiplodia theobromae]|uniref:Histone-lysine N-methyltransferase, H3 lysine-79 specific n=2 Tax=Lasiodiplodia TaxID=66739 RepID=A0A5N5DER9_9PEZI|nr:Histone-lysine n- h3 lysine-79 specific [Lasiodiplodia theobromae]KAB2576346.1 Histone-lysine N-methyltransferase [Lasiodiplodia theobromae]KAF4543980.1 Histone-lysine n- h3 lysine-79 specific [Lasiodiplodia theobromae]KAF9629246.1 Histone methylation DOT1 [Lasiodiplodia theobromae]KAK0664104.1 Histone-lysine N-methyltransferase [Lasiodiplodia hormozganensis]
MNIDFKKKPVIRTQTVLVRRTNTPTQSPSPATPRPRPKLPTPASRAPASSSRLNGALSSSVAAVAGRRHASAPAVPTVKRSLTKRKAPTPATPLSSDSEGSDGEDSLDRELTPRKRIRASHSLEPDLQRKIRAAPLRRADGEEGPVKLRILHGYDLVKTDHWKDDNVVGYHATKDFKPAFEGLSEVPVVGLQYPSKSQPERFSLVYPRESDGYKPLEDIVQSVETICKHYFPDDADTLIDEGTGFPRRLKRAVQQQSVSAFKDVLQEFNKMISDAVASGKIDQALDEMQSMPLPLTEYILSQTYSRTVSPRVNSLRRYEAGSNNVYGELLPRFVHRIFQETKLKSDQIFVDLGSGVGNVVLQAALEVGCESWGVESMPNPSFCASLQKKEIMQRARLWGISLGKINVIADDFLENQEVGRVLNRADVIVVNNKAFSPQLNGALLDKFLDLKEGAKIVSLKPFVDPDHEIKSHNVNDRVNLFSCVEKEYFSGSVSWTDEGGKYYIQVKDRSRLDRFLEGSRRRR